MQVLRKKGGPATILSQSSSIRRGQRDPHGKGRPSSSPRFPRAPPIEVVAVLRFLQILIGHSYFLEQPKGSDMFTKSPIAKPKTYNLPHASTLTDQCMHGACIEGVAIRTSTEILPVKELKEFSPQLPAICDGKHPTHN